MRDLSFEITWGGKWNATRPISYPKCAIVVYMGRVFLALRDVPAGTSINDRAHWRKICNVYEALQTSEVI